MMSAPARRASHSAPLAGFGRLLCMLLLGLALTSCKVKVGDDKGKDGKPGEADAGVEAVPVEVVPASRRTIAASYAGTATLDVLKRATVTAKVSGVIRRVYVDVGDRVVVGQPLVQLDTERSSLAAEQARAQLLKLEADNARAKQLLSQKMISASDADTIRFNLENARAQYNAAKLELSYATIVAPISGVVSSMHANLKPGYLGQIGQDMVDIIDASELEAVLNVPEREIATIKEGHQVALAVDALPGRSFTGRVARIAPMVDAGSGTFRVFCRFASAGDSGGAAALLPGMFGRIRIEYDQRANALVIPRNALLEDGGTPAVYVVQDGKAVRTALTPGYIDGEWVEVRDGLKEGAQVVVAGKTSLREGSAVQVLGGKADASSATQAVQ